MAAIAFGQALTSVGDGWEYVLTEPYDDHSCLGQVVACARQFRDHAYPDLRPRLNPGVGAGKPAA